jgi:hypothetical protein
MDRWIFIIDTDQYAGNFEREMCAYITGHIGECGVGEELAGCLKKETGLNPDTFFSNILQVADEHGCHRPVETQPNPNWFNDGHGNEWRVTDDDVEKQLKKYVKSVADYYTPLIKQIESYIPKLQKGERISNWTVTASRREIAEHKKEIEKAKKLKKVSRYPAHLSVGIWFESEPNREQIELMKDRANKFKTGRHSKQPEIEGFRLVCEKTTTTTSAV